MSEYPFRFEKSPKKKGTCPQCKHTNQFRFYEDREGNRQGDEFGKCERTNSCGYHQSPLVGNTDLTKLLVSQVINNQEIILPNKAWNDKFESWLQNPNSNLHLFWIAKGITQEHFLKHSVATDNKGKTVFILKNKDGRIVNAKWVTYAPNGHRVKEKDKPNSYTMRQPTDGKAKYAMCLYGEDLLDPKKERKVIIVESEKTKVVASFHYPEIDWISCGSNNGLTDDKISVLFGRKIIWLCDADKAGRDNSSIKKLKSYKQNFEVIDLFPDRADGYDIADAIEDGLKPLILDGVRIMFDAEEVEEPKEETKSQESQYILKSDSVQYRKNTSIWVKTRNNWEIIADNFHVFIKYFTQDENEQNTWILELKILSRESIFIEIPHEDFCSAKKMKTILASKRLSFKASDIHISELHSLLFKTDFGTATKINRFGFHRDSGTYFFSNRALTADGKIIEPDEFSIIQSDKYCLSMPMTNVKMKKRFFLTDNEVTFNDWFKVYSDAHTMDKAFIPVCFYVMSLFRDVMVKHKGSSPIMYLKGSAGTGKSSIIRSLTCLFGFQQEDINLKSKNTEAALVKLMSQSANSLIWMDEYHNDFDHEGLLQAAYDNAGYHKTPDSSKSNTETDSIDIHSALALTSNFIPSNDIFFSRCLLIQVENKEKTSQQKEGYAKLKEMEALGLGIITVEILRHRSLILENYSKAFKQLSGRIEEHFKHETIAERLISNMVQTMTCAYILQCHGLIAVCESTEQEDILNDFVDMGVLYMRKQLQIQEEASILSEFFGIIQMLYEDFKLHEGVHFRFDGNLLSLRWSSIYPIYKQRYRSVYHKDSPDKDSILQEILKLELPRVKKEVIRTIRFRDETILNNNTLNNSSSNSLSITYNEYLQRFGLDLTNRNVNV